MGIQLGSASYKNHTVCIEQFFTDEALWNKAQTTINGTGISIPHNQTTKFHYNVGSTEYYYTKTIIQVKKITAFSHFIYYTTHIDNVAPSSPNQLSLHLVVYGVDSYLNDVDSSVYNLNPFEIVGDHMQMQLNLDMNGKKILNFNFNFNYVYSQVFDHFYDIRGTRNYELKVNVSGFVINKIKPELHLENDPRIRDYDPKYGLKFATKSYILTDAITKNSNWTIFVSFKHDETKTCTVPWSNTLGIYRQFHPIFKITGDKISIQDRSGTDERQFTSD